MFHTTLYSLLPSTRAVSTHRLGVCNDDKYNQLSFTEQNPETQGVTTLFSGPISRQSTCSTDFLKTQI